MGSVSQSSESNNYKYGKWTDDYCKCKEGSSKVFYDDTVTDIYWRSTYLVNDNLRRLTTAGRVFTLGISEILFKGKSLTHDYVEVRVICSKCGEEKWVTFEYGCNGKCWSIGYYSKNYSLHGSIFNCNRRLEPILKIYKDLEGFEGEDYNFISNNCKTFAKKFFKLLYNN